MRRLAAKQSDELPAGRRAVAGRQQRVHVGRALDDVKIHLDARLARRVGEPPAVGVEQVARPVKIVIGGRPERSPYSGLTRGSSSGRSPAYIRPASASPASRSIGSCGCSPWGMATSTHGEMRTSRARDLQRHRERKPASGRVPHQDRARRHGLRRTRDHVDAVASRGG